MAFGKCKSRDGNQNICLGKPKPDRVELDGIIVVHPYNPLIVTKCMASSVNNCIQTQLVAGCSMRMSWSDVMWCNYDHMDSMMNLPEINNAISFLTRNSFIAGLNKSPVATWVSQNITISVNGEIIDNDKRKTEGNNMTLSTLHKDEKN